jgi:metal-responsive CopG/Arc/MetJ family transcriptional regulator
MSTVAAPDKPAQRLVRITLPADFVREIDKIAEVEMLSRTAWMRRVLNSAVKFSRWHASVSKN